MDTYQGPQTATATPEESQIAALLFQQSDLWERAQNAEDRNQESKAAGFRRQAREVGAKIRAMQAAQ